MLVGPAAFATAAAPFAMLRSGTILSPLLQSVLGTLVTSVVLYRWFKYVLYDDWKLRRALLLRQDKFPWGAFVSIGFVLFWVEWLLVSYAILSLWSQFVMSQMPSGTEIALGAPIPLVAQLPIGPVSALVLDA